MDGEVAGMADQVGDADGGFFAGGSILLACCVVVLLALVVLSVVLWQHAGTSNVPASSPSARSLPVLPPTGCSIWPCRLPGPRC